MSDRSFNPRISARAARSLTAFRSDDERMRSLARTIEAEIVPRLLMSAAAANPAGGNTATAGCIPEPADLHEFTRLLLVHDAAVASAFLQIQRERGMADDHLCLQLLAPAARLLGEFWERGACDSAQLTLGLVRIHALLQEISGRL